MIQSLHTSEDLVKVVSENDVVVIDLYATWCVPCQQMLPVVEELAETMPVPFYKVDIDEVPSAKEFTGAKAVPMLMIYKKGKRREFAFGVVEKEKIESKINRIIESPI
jgi:thioredoxin 1